MSYVALARKFRPQDFDQVVAQDFVVRTLKNAIEMGRISHAYLFTGPRGVGKTSSARIFAKAVNCLSPKGVNPCNECENCTEITSGTAMDVVEIDGASNRGIDEIRELREAVRFIPVKSSYKVYIIDEVHMLTEAAFNALLKTLEEPPGHVIFILATTDPHRIPATILSRCQRYDFRTIPYDDMYTALVEVLDNEQIEYESDALNIVIRNADGCMRDALSLLDQVIAFTGSKVDQKHTLYLLGHADMQLVDDLFAAVLKEDVPAVPRLVDEISSKGIDYKHAVERLVEHTRNLLFTMVETGGATKQLTTREIEYYQRMKEFAGKGKLYALFQIFQKLLVDVKMFSFERYVFEFAMFKAASIAELIPALAGTAPTAPKTAAPKPAAPASSPAAPKQAAPAPKQATPEPKPALPEEKQAPAQPIAPKAPEPTADEADVPPPDLDDTDKLWQKVLDKLEDASQAQVASQLSFGYISSMEEPELVVGFAKERVFHYERATKPKNLEALKNAIRGVIPGITEVRLVLEDGGKKKAVIEKTRQIETYNDRKTRREATEDPLVNKLVERFRGDVVDVAVHRKSGSKEE